MRVEASAYRGRPVQFVLSPVGTGPRFQPSFGVGIPPALDVLLMVTVFASVAVLAILARRNLKLGRGDRKGAFRLALAVLVIETIYFVLNRHWTFEPLRMVQVLLFTLGAPLFAGLQTWLTTSAPNPSCVAAGQGS